MLGPSAFNIMLKKLIILTVFCIFAGAAALTGGYYYLVVLHPGEEIQAEYIKGLLARESNVYYSDGVTKLGVFFDSAHRQYVDYENIPKNFVNALVASEDDKYFRHFGFDAAGIVRAMIKNFQAGRVVQGGSTLTQQTAKNLFKRSDRSYEAKLKELLFALRLEYHYSKEDIFEFYANQFYVSGNGHGLGVAARYYFDKKPEELNLVECAFIAGSVKRPNYYNPFYRKTEQAVAQAEQRAQVRLKYVLDKMLALQMIDSADYRLALANNIPFSKGQVGYDLDYAMELVRDAVSTDEVQDGLLQNNIENIATSGVRVITTIDKNIQDKMLTSLRAELSRLDVLLRGYKGKEVQEELKLLEYTGDSSVQAGAFVFGRITGLEIKGKEPVIEVELGKKLGVGRIHIEGLENVLTAWTKYQRNKWTRVEKNDLKTFLKEFEVGDRVWVRIVDIPQEDLPIELALEKYPQIQGGAVAMRKGQIRGVVGGTENRFFNRAMYGKRTMGSAFKPLVYSAAIQLGWNSGDLLKNSRELFAYQGQPYFPRPDHKSPHQWVSMSWAGVKSENVASVWLLANLCEKLNPPQFREVAEKLDLTPGAVDGEQEPYKTYRRRIRDRHGIQITKDILRSAAYAVAVKNLESDFIFDGMMEDYRRLESLQYGINFDRYKASINLEIAQKRKKGKVSSGEWNEYAVRRALLAESFLFFEALNKSLNQYKKLMHVSQSQLWSDDGRFTGFGRVFFDDSTGNYSFYGSGSAPDNARLLVPSELKKYLDGLDDIDQDRFWQNIQIRAGITARSLDLVIEQTEKEYEILNRDLPYSFDVLSKIPDFRIMVGLYYLRQLAREVGIESDLEPVLSFPLGSNVVTLFEATRMYEALVTGKVYRPRGDGDDATDSLTVLDRIEDNDGRLVYRAEQSVTRVLDDKVSIPVGHILENVVKFGTGRLANTRVKLTGDQEGEESEYSRDFSVPLLGKTGTANNYTNASFLGYLPEVGENGGGLSLEDGYAVGVYVGYDNNKAMRRKSTRISGAGGALPTWCDIVNVLITERKYGEKLDPVDLSFYGLNLKRRSMGQVNFQMLPDEGGRMAEPYQRIDESERFTPSILTFGGVKQGKSGSLEHYYLPFWQSRNLTQN